MSMGLYSLPGVYQSSWVEMTSTVMMRYEIDQDNEQATLYFGQREEYVLTLGQDNLAQLVDLGAAAQRELAIRVAANQ
jgi:hypothetical protein